MGDRLADIVTLLLILHYLTVFPIAHKGMSTKSIELLALSTILSSVYFLVVAVIYLLKSYGIIK